ncbi:hypothetical protein EGJ24_15450 [Stenotrophomonas maltophilia]|nr:hypothetical protein EGJ24_15450 [Stenotrophomonas maltophilia]
MGSAGLRPAPAEAFKQRQRQKRVFRGLAGRCRSAGCQPHGCGCQAYRDVLAASPHSDTAPPPTDSVCCG